MDKFLRAINPFVWYLAYKTSQKLKEKSTVSDFAHKHRHLVVIVLDPEEDTMFMAYRDQQVLNKIKSADGENYHVVKNVMKASRFKGAIDRLIISLVDFMKVPLTTPAMQHLMKWIDGATFAIGQRMTKLKNEDAMFPGKVKEPEKEMAVLNPKNY